MWRRPREGQPCRVGTWVLNDEDKQKNMATARGRSSRPTPCAGTGSPPGRASGPPAPGRRRSRRRGSRRRRAVHDEPLTGGPARILPRDRRAVRLSPRGALRSWPARSSRPPTGRLSGTSPDGRAADGGVPLDRSWPIYRQLTGPDKLGRGAAAECGIRVPPPPDGTGRPGGQLGLPLLRGRLLAARLVKDEQVIQIEGNPASPISRGRLCPKGSASRQLVTGPQRAQEVLYHRPTAPRGRSWTWTPQWT